MVPDVLLEFAQNCQCGFRITEIEMSLGLGQSNFARDGGRGCARRSVDSVLTGVFQRIEGLRRLAVHGRCEQRRTGIGGVDQRNGKCVSNFARIESGVVADTVRRTHRFARPIHRSRKTFAAC